MSSGTKQRIIVLKAILKVFRHQYLNLKFGSFFKPKATEVADFLDSHLAKPRGFSPKHVLSLGFKNAQYSPRV
jgi:hypothetical protein